MSKPAQFPPNLDALRELIKRAPTKESAIESAHYDLIRQIGSVLGTAAIVTVSARIPHAALSLADWKRAETGFADEFVRLVISLLTLPAQAPVTSSEKAPIKRCEPPAGAYGYHWIVNSGAVEIGKWLATGWKIPGVVEMVSPEELWQKGWRYERPVA